METPYGNWSVLLCARLGSRKTKKVEITGSFLRQSTEMMTNTSKAKLKSATWSNLPPQLKSLEGD